MDARLERGEEGHVRAGGLGVGGIGPGEDRALRGQPVDRRGGGPRGAVAAEAIGAQRVERDEQQVAPRPFARDGRGDDVRIRPHRERQRRAVVGLGRRFEAELDPAPGLTPEVDVVVGPALPREVRPAGEPRLEEPALDAVGDRGHGEADGGRL